MFLVVSPDFKYISKSNKEIICIVVILVYIIIIDYCILTFWMYVHGQMNDGSDYCDSGKPELKLIPF